ncbi:glycosyltransferase family 4 protein [Nesterenkonia sp. LB17]|uniref:glycosyltransferase family 4 protein n=1 Tax=unclassified Nesterenkonia TaxID=2629769 RepID=UPI001F4CCB9A|nr:MULTISPECIES: glycosyltransferase family 4 protein [unclassified Nesterenkonia]MCH8559801.1 glycosyltransferase family 4 protein [Nesterenkonia sp. DZ6]MCH8561965.1 glycosyltransferase family 4 protein [Nesterenkonia sp. YGD6]MCH8564498.1 glycosyltransferase family 4 protein [Nesterenkonia sp. LB17]MCH8570124.1 glycosyltransferase family 4 protein [Nesterenkonia sp. AY15]
MSVEHTVETTPAPTHDPCNGTPAVPRDHVVGYVLKMYPRFSETFIVSEILAREAAGEQIVIFSLRPSTDARFHPELARVKAPVIQVPRSSTSSKLWAQLALAAASPALAPGLQRSLPELLAAGHDDAQQAVGLAHAAHQAGVTHLHAHFASIATTVARLAGRISGLPYSFTAHAKDIFHEDVDQHELQAKLAEAHHAITISGYNLDDLRTRFPAAAQRLHLVRNGLELSRFPFTPNLGTQPAPDPSLESPPRPARLLGIGRLVEKKGFHLLIEAVARLRDEGLDVQADIAGDGPLANHLQQQIDDAGLRSSVRLLGPCTQQEVAELLGSHDVFVAPFVIGADGNADGLPTVLLEAMARGIRCVAAEVTAVGEVVRPGETGWLVPAGDVTALTAAVAEAITTDPGHLRMLEAGRTLIEQNFDSAAQSRRLQALVSDPASPAAQNRLAAVQEPV